MKIIYSYHAEERMRQRGINELEAGEILKHPFYIKKSFEGTKEAVGKIENRVIKIKFIEMENYIKIITVM